MSLAQEIRRRLADAGFSADSEEIIQLREWNNQVRDRATAKAMKSATASSRTASNAPAA